MLQHSCIPVYSYNRIMLALCCIHKPYPWSLPPLPFVVVLGIYFKNSPLFVQFSVMGAGAGAGFGGSWLGLIEAGGSSPPTFLGTQPVCVS